MRAPRTAESLFDTVSSALAFEPSGMTSQTSYSDSNDCNDYVNTSASSRACNGVVGSSWVQLAHVPTVTPLHPSHDGQLTVTQATIWE